MKNKRVLVTVRNSHYYDMLNISLCFDANQKYCDKTNKNSKALQFIIYDGLRLGIKLINLLQLYLLGNLEMSQNILNRLCDIVK